MAGFLLNRPVRLTTFAWVVFSRYHVCMGEEQTPLIKGMFINSHIEWLRKEKGPAAVDELCMRIGKFTDFDTFADYPVSQEIEVIGHLMELLQGSSDPLTRDFEAGRLHFRNFSETMFGKLTMSIAPRTEEGFKTLMQAANYIGRYVFKYTNFTTEVLGDRSVKVVMENNDYPIDHFRGLFYEWAVFWGLPNPTVTAKETARKRYEYTIEWGER